jgi:hypothetical protein
MDWLGLLVVALLYPEKSHDRARRTNKHVLPPPRIQRSPPIGLSASLA